MDEIVKIVKQFIEDPTGDYRYLGELEVGKHFVEYMFTGDYVEDDIMLCVGTKRFLVVEANVCRWAEVDEEVLAMDYIAEKENIEKSYNFGASEFNRKMKRITQERLAKGLPVSLGIPNDADAEDLAMLNAFDKWLRDCQPVE